MTDDKTLVIDRVFDVSPERVFAAFTETAQLAQWYGPEGMTAEIFSNDVSPEGNKTHLRLTHGGFAEASDATAHNQGWTSSLNDLARYLAS
jgi:uncharacterized protein YndB with AHSA1/START domain